MRCLYCKNETRVLDSRESENSIRRRRECMACGKRFTTYERAGGDLTVVKKDKRREAFSREKLRAGLVKACEKRPVSVEQIDRVLGKIEAKMRQRKSREVSSKAVGEEVIKLLKKLDKVAYIRFASVYREFEDPLEFAREVKGLKTRGREKKKGSERGSGVKGRKERGGKR